MNQADVETDLVRQIHLRTVGRRMIRETETFLNQRLRHQCGSWVRTDLANDRLDPRGIRPDRRRHPHSAQKSVNLRTSATRQTLVEVLPNARGIVDDLRLRDLESELRNLTGDKAAGDIVIEVKHVEVMTAGFMSLLAIMRPRLACQRRRLSLAGLRPQCALMLRDSGLEELLVA